MNHLCKRCVTGRKVTVAKGVIEADTCVGAHIEGERSDLMWEVSPIPCELVLGELMIFATPA